MRSSTLSIDVTDERVCTLPEAVSRSRMSLRDSSNFTTTSPATDSRPPASEYDWLSFSTVRLSLAHDIAMTVIAAMKTYLIFFICIFLSLVLVVFRFRRVVLVRIDVVVVFHVFRGIGENRRFSLSVLSFLVEHEDERVLVLRIEILLGVDRNAESLYLLIRRNRSLEIVYREGEGVEIFPIEESSGREMKFSSFSELSTKNDNY